MNTPPQCPVCGMDNTYFDGTLFVCPDCTHEWAAGEEANEATSGLEVKDSNGNLLQDGDSVILIKDLKVKGSSLVIKKGTKIKNIRLCEGDHNLDCKVDGVGLKLKSEFMKKA